MTQMLALRGHEGEKTARAVHIDVPEVGDDDVLVKIMAASLVLGTFNLLELGKLWPLPMTLGHEGAGVITAIGKSVRNLNVGDRVRIHPTITCGRCRHCLTGLEHMCEGAGMMGFVALGRKTVENYDRYHNGFLAEYAVAPQKQIDKLPDNVSFDIGAKLHYIANAVRCLKAANLAPGSTIIILAPTGSMGTLTIKLAPFFGVARIVLVGRTAERLHALRALTLLQTDVVALDALEEDWAKTNGLSRKIAELLPDGAHAVLDYAPHGANLWQAMDGLANGGQFVNMGGGFAPFPAPITKILAHCWSFVGTRNNTRQDVMEALELLTSGRLQVDDLISHKFKLAEVEVAVKTVLSREQAVWMGIVNP
jgi:threonine dehydrogenase-like Zn-dependent dehydrogenase